MKHRKQWWTLAAGLALGAGARAEEGVSVYGVYDGAFASYKGAGQAQATLGMIDGALETPFFGIKAAEDLGGGGHLRVILEGFYNSTNGAMGRPIPGGDSMFAREAAVEWGGSAGAIKLGRIDAPALIPTLRLDPLGGAPVLSPLFTHTFTVGIAQNAGTANETAGLLGGNTFTDTQWDSAIKISLPKSAGLDASVFYQFGGTAGQPGKRNLGINALYKAGPFSIGGYLQDDWICNPLGCLTVNVATGAQSVSLTNVLVAEEKTWFLGASYDFGPAQLYAGYNHYSLGSADPFIATNVLEAGNFGSSSRMPEASVAVPIGDARLILAWAETRTSLSGGSDVRWATTSLVYDWNLSKRTDVYAGAMTESLSSYDSGHLVTLGMRHRF